MSIGDFFTKLRQRLSCKRSVETREPSVPRNADPVSKPWDPATRNGRATTPSVPVDAPWPEVDARAVVNIFEDHNQPPNHNHPEDEKKLTRNVSQASTKFD